MRTRRKLRPRCGRRRNCALETLESRVVLSVNANPFPTTPFQVRASDGMPILNSLPTAPAAIFLDFDGSNNGPYAPIAPFDLDGNPGTFNAQERAVIYENWRQTAVYFAMFNVNVTTIQPDVSKIPTAWCAYGVNSWTDGGLSQVGVFPNTTTQSILGGGFGSIVADTFAHEVAHNFGLWHIGTYNTLGEETQHYGTPRDPLHGPIMGNGTGALVQKWMYWHGTGGNGNATTLQDDIARIANALAAAIGGDGFRDDDHPNLLTNAKLLEKVGNTQAIVGILERPTDVDVFQFTSTGGSYNIAVGRETASGVDVKISVYDAQHNLIASHDGDPRKQPYAMVNDSQVTLALAAGTYYLKVESHGNYGDIGAYIVRVDPMAAGWTGTDIGLTGVAGFSGYNASSGVFTVAGSGADIQNTADGFQFLYQVLQGNGEIVARILSTENTHSSSKAGLMIRDSLAPDAVNAMVLVKPGGSAQMQYRSTTGGSTTVVNGPSGTAYRWVRIVRSGNTITAYVSNQSASTPIGSIVWTQIAQRTIAMGSRVYIGLATTSHDNTELNIATYASVQVTGNVNPAAVQNGLPAPSGVTVASTTHNSVTIAWAAAGVIRGDTNGDGIIDLVDYANVKNNFGRSVSAWTSGDTNGDGVVDLIDYANMKNNFGRFAPTGYVIERSADGARYEQIGTVSADVGIFTDDGGLSDGLRYFYRVSAAVGSTVSAGTVTSAETRAGVVTNLRIISYSTTQLILDWTDASGETGYRIQRSTNGTSGWVNVATVGRNVPMFVNSGLTIGMHYYYRIVTIDALGDSVISEVVSASTRIAAPTNLRFTNKASNQMAIAWNAVSGATGYRVERSLDRTTWTVLSANQTALTYVDNAVSPATAYYYRVTAVDPTRPGTPSAVLFAATPAATALPSPWQSIDIGISGSNGARTGAAQLSGGTFTIIGGGADIWGSSDAFRFTYVAMTGNGSITARVSSLLNTNYFARAGVMIRNTSTGTNTAANSRFVAVMVHQSEAGIRYQYRQSNGGGTLEDVLGGPGSAQAAPYWVRLTRTGNTFLGEASIDGVNWVTVSSRTVTMNSTVLIGLALTPRDNGYLNRATFTNVSTTVTGLVGASAASSFGAASARNAQSPESSLLTAGANLTLGAAKLPATKRILAQEPVRLADAVSSRQIVRPLVDLALVDFDVEPPGKRLSISLAQKAVDRVHGTDTLLAELKKRLAI